MCVIILVKPDLFLFLCISQNLATVCVLVCTLSNGWILIMPDVSARHQVSVFTPLMLQQVA